MCIRDRPILGLQGGADSGERCELLIRLRDEDGKLIPPGLFIPAAERFGMMTLIDRWVIDRALGDIARRLAANLSDRHAVFSINLSGSSFGDKHFLADIKSFFEQYQVCLLYTSRCV